MDYTFTIFTPCYNGEKTIKRVFDSVLAQTYDKWEWIIINDGSTDNSEMVINRMLNNIISDKKCRITFISQANKGKHVAWNKAVEMAKGDFFLSADCDDSFKSNTLEYFNKKANELCQKDFLHSHFSGVNVCCYRPKTNERVGDAYPIDGLVSDNIELAYRYKINGEHWGIVRTDILKQIKFPELTGHFYNESYLWFTIAKQYKVICFNEMLRSYFFEQQSLVNNKNYKLDYDRAVMELSFNWWRVKEIGNLIWRYSKVDYFKAFIMVGKCITKVVLAKVKR